ncbi:hypothetical protein SCT_1797 [Sulfuricella sp. T08]|uniref:hypothetical protein n=1 Tax=Sulfuricella sp. T08 TaxID=1632857 RepID=UPI0006179F22|nr:hypothetical protein [Sulfuricella sp. T08]GAO36391.1 hypothetical protein SCT_1797 [Sulfuricella sp. T08]
MQTSATQPDPAQNEFQRQMSGLLYSLLKWAQLSEFWTKVDKDAGWYLYAVGEAVPIAPATPAQVEKFIVEMDALLRQDHRESYCGIVYADCLDKPSFIKIYDPNHLGVSCGSSKNAILPGWIMSLAPPTELHLKYALPANRQRWWQGLFSQK